MDLREPFLRQILAFARDGHRILLGFDGEAWPYATSLRNALLRIARGDEEAWGELMELRANDPILAAFMREFAEQIWPAADLQQVAALQAFLARLNEGDSAVWDELVEHGRNLAKSPTTCEEFCECLRSLGFSQALEEISGAAAGTLDNLRASDLDFLVEVLQPDRPAKDAKPARSRPSKSRIMYIERKAGELTGEARIGRVTLSKSGKSIYYRGKRFETQSGRGYKSNYFEVETGEEYWISGPRRDGQDRLYAERRPIEIDEDAREEYWTAIRKRPEFVDKKVV
jgi:hypothetical protein